jgi:hypothetical protein
MKKIFLVTLCCFSLYACTKEVGSISYTQSLLSNKTWFLDYTIKENTTKSFIGKSTYFIQFSNTGKTIDSDGITGNYTIQESNKSLSIFIEGTTQNGSPATYNYLIEQIGSDQLIVSFQIDGIKTKKIFSTTH